MHHILVGKLTLLLYNDRCVNAYSWTKTGDLWVIF